MILLPTGLVLVDGSTKWGLVTIANKDGTLNREYTISGKEADAVAQGNNVLPPGCTPEEWNTRGSQCAGKVCNPGQAYQTPEGALIVNYGVTEADQRVDWQVMKFPKAEFDLQNSIVRINAVHAAEVDVPLQEVKPGDLEKAP